MPTATFSLATAADQQDLVTLWQAAQPSIVAEYSGEPIAGYDLARLQQILAARNEGVVLGRVDGALRVAGHCVWDGSMLCVVMGVLDPALTARQRRDLGLALWRAIMARLPDDGIVRWWVRAGSNTDNVFSRYAVLTRTVIGNRAYYEGRSADSGALV